jgi:NAD(P)-dependent dehydrogenase (short-subunit alcohol dehydrogenase family)
MSVLREDVMRGLTVAADDGAAPFAAALAARGARAALGEPALAPAGIAPVEAGRTGANAHAGHDSAPPALDLLLVSLPPADPAAAADGTLATAFTEAFATARSTHGQVAAGGCILFLQAGHSPEAVDGLSALTRSLALEWAPRGVRVNALCHTCPVNDCVELVAIIASPASRMLTGAVMHV